MTDSNNLPSQYTLEVENFGPIRQGRIDLRPLTVFVGPSNTGKSYLATVVYALHKFLEQAKEQLYQTSKFEDSTVQFGSMTVGEIYAKIVGDIRAAHDGENVSTPRKIQLSESVIDSLVEYLNTCGELLGQEIARCFGREIDEFKPVSFDGQSRLILTRTLPKSTESEVVLDYRFGSSSLGVNCRPLDFCLSEDNYKRLFRVWTTHAQFAKIYEIDDDRELVSFVFRKTVFGLILEQILDYLFEDLTSPAHYLPANRSAVLHGHGVVVASAIRQAAETGLKGVPSKRFLTGVQADYLSSIIENGASATNRETGFTAAHRHAKQIEETILKGAIQIERDKITDYPDCRYFPEDWESPLSVLHASSMVGELAPIVMFLRYRVQAGNLIVVEEPESHLHPAMQVQLFSILASLITNEHRVLITTHSEWLVEALGNMVTRAQLQAKSEPVSEEEKGLSIPEKMVGTWWFTPGPSETQTSGVVVQEVRHQLSNGMYTVGFDEVSNSLYNEWAKTDSQLDPQA